LQANNGYAWTDGDVCQIPQTDTVEGAATGASFSGLGVENQPHQVLLNKIQLTHTKQLLDETAIATLQNFVGAFTSALGPSGWLKLGVQDVSKGFQQAIVQWGVVALSTVPTTYSFPIAFPNACFIVIAQPLVIEDIPGVFDVPGIVNLTAAPSRTQFTMAASLEPGDTWTVYWLALGY
jgi:hypothetical protein